MKECFNPPSLPRPGRLHYSQVVKKGKMVFLTGMMPEGPMESSSALTSDRNPQVSREHARRH